MFKPAMKLGAAVVFCATVFACASDDEGSGGTGGGGVGGGSGGVSGMAGMTGGVGGATGGVGGATGGVGGMTGGVGGMTGGMGGMTGGMGGMTGGTGGVEPTFAPTWSAIYAEIIMAKGCNGGAQCHGGSGGGLNLSTMDGGYDALIDVDAMGVFPGGTNCFGTGIKRVVPMQPEMSLFYQKLAHTHTCGGEMPPAQPKLPDAQLEQVRMWIAAGAMEN